MKKAQEHKALVEEAVSKLDTSDSMLLIVEAGILHESMVYVTKHMLARDKYGIYVCLNKPHDAVSSILKRSSVDTKRVYFVDCVTALAKETLTTKGAKVIYAVGPHDISDKGTIPNAIKRFIRSVPGEKFLIIDALRTLFIYNEPKLVSTFIHLLLTLTSAHDVKLIVLTRKEDDVFIGMVKAAFDEVVEI